MVAEKSDENHMVCAQINEEHFIRDLFLRVIYKGMRKFFPQSTESENRK